MRACRRSGVYSAILFAALAAAPGVAYFGIPFSETPGAAVKVKELNYVDVSFGSSTVVLGRTVNCEAEQVYNTSYPGPMYTCKNISVDGVRIAYGVMPKGSDKPVHRCGTDNGRNSIYWLCVALLDASNIHSRMWAAYAPEASCDILTGDRVRFVHDGQSTFWEDSTDSNGYMLTLQCLTEAVH